MAEAIAASTGTSSETKTVGAIARTHIQDFLISRELAEVYLLLDNISSVQIKALPQVPAGSILLDPGEGWIEQVCEIAWPPDSATIRNESLMAAQLIKAKDLLNTAAAPATGASIAFTTLLTGDTGDGRGRSWWKAVSDVISRRHPDEQMASVDVSPSVWPPTRGSLAALAYPNFARSAWRYQALRNFLILFLSLWLVATCIFSWDVATGGALLNRVNDLNARGIAQTAASVQAAARIAAPTPTPTPTPTSPTPTASPTAAATPAAVVKTVTVATVTTPDGDQTCTAEDVSKRQQCAVAWGNLRHWLAARNWPRRMFAGLMGGDPGRGGDKEGNLINLEWAAVFLSVLTGTILPIAYGVLGAAAAVVRGISMKMRDYTLMPRDLNLAGIQLALGAVIGACIGLFVSPDGAATPGGLVGPVHLTQSALCFVAGFGVEGVFLALEALVRRVFNLDTGKPPAKDQSTG